MTAEPSGSSIWEVTRLILASPDTSPSEIAQLHGYSAAEVAELMPIFLDTARTDWSQHADTVGDWAAPPDHDAELYLRDLAGSGSVDVAAFGGAPGAGETLPPDVGGLLDGDTSVDDSPADDGSSIGDVPTGDGSSIGDVPTGDGSSIGDVPTGDIPTSGAPTSDGDPSDVGAADPGDDGPADHPAADGDRFDLGEDDPFGDHAVADHPFDDGPDGDAFGDPDGFSAPEPAADVDDAVDGPFSG